MLALLAPPEARGKIVLFAGVDNVRFQAAVEPRANPAPGDAAGSLSRPVGKGEGKAFVDATGCSALSPSLW